MNRLPNRSAWEKDRAHLLHPYADFASFETEGSQVITEASGMTVIDDTGRAYLDGIGGLWCVNVGHGRREIADAMHAQTLRMQYYNAFGHTTNVPAAELGAKLADLAPTGINHVYYTCGGSTGNDAAVRIVHYYFEMRGEPRKKKIISRNHAYHGATYVAASLTGMHGTKLGFDRIGEDFIHHISAADMYRRPAGMDEAAYCDHLVAEFEDRIEQLGPANCAAFIAEPIMGAGGVLVAPKGYHRRMQEVCRRHGMLYIADEVVTAFGRLGEWFASEALYDTEPDIIVCAKGLTSGYVPLGATLIHDRVWDVISRPQAEGAVFSMGVTYFGHPVACAAALANLAIMEDENLLAHVREVGPYLQSEAAKLNDLPLVGDVRGAGLMLGIELTADKAARRPLEHGAKIVDRVFRACLDAGVIVRPVGDRIILSPPLIITRDQIDRILSVLRDALARTEATL